MQQNYLLELDGKPAGRFFSFGGGMPEGEVVTVPMGPGQIDRKHIANIRFQDMELACGTGMSAGFYEWLAKSLSGFSSRQAGAVISFDEKQTPAARLEFRDAIIKSLVLPELEQTTKKEAYMTVSISPEMTKVSEKKAKTDLGVYVSNMQKVWNIADFRVKIDGLETDCAHVTSVNSLRLGQGIKEMQIGQSRYPQKEATKIEYPNLVLGLPGMFADGFYKWLDNSLVRGNASEKTGTLEFFAPNSNKPYFGLELQGLGIFQISGSSGLPTKTNTPIKVSLYCESMKFYAGAAAIK